MTGIETAFWIIVGSGALTVIIASAFGKAWWRDADE